MNIANRASFANVFGLFFLTTAALLPAITAEAAKVECVTGKNASVVAASFQISDASSRRLLSDVTYNKMGSIFFISSSELAQYKVTEHEVYFLSDDPQGNRIIKLSAFGRKNSFFGALSEFSMTGELIWRTKVRCNILPN